MRTQVTVIDDLTTKKRVAIVKESIEETQKSIIAKFGGKISDFGSVVNSKVNNRSTSFSFKSL